MLRNDIHITATLVLILINIAVSYAAFNNPTLMDKLKFNPHSVAHRKEWWRFITHGFVHADTLHLVVNMMSLYYLGSAIEQIYIAQFGGKALLYYLILYFGGLIMAIIPTYEKHKNNIWYNSVGASGAVSSVVFAFVVYAPFVLFNLFFILPIPAIVYAILYVVYSIYADRRGGDNINHSAHLSGAFLAYYLPLLSITRRIRTLLLIFKTSSANKWGPKPYF